MTIAKTFDPAAIEAHWYPHWEASGRFRPARDTAEPFTVLMPPPNVTGTLHIGHALDITLQDILVRHARLRGRDALWVVGTDHAGIATQMVVERQLAAEGGTRQALGRDGFVERVWRWKTESGGAITRQLRRLGASCDWANERFTMDPGFSRAVTRVFVELHARGLLYRDKRLVNWDPHFRTAISDLEVETREVAGHFWHLSYPLADGSGRIEVATTRPETLLADMAVAVHPEDERYRALVGRQVRLPLTGRLVPIVTDEHADPALGSGAVKITPGHDFNDFDVGVRAGIKPADMLTMLDAAARIVQTADGLVPAELLGLDRVAARDRIVAMLAAEDALVRVEPRQVAQPFGDRSGVVIEPFLTDQWYVDAARLAGPALAAVHDGAIRVVPETWTKTWNQWLENIQPWCVSRQLWWGHQVPAWYGPDGRAYVAETAADAQAQAGADVPLTRDPDVLDTWFSSALWPFATLGWPDDMATLRRHYPSDVLVSGFDILFFWDARMAMQGIEFMGERPWKTLYLHGLVRDATGAKMSKSKGNTVDPLGLVERYGADALRFTLAAMESQGRDIKLDEKRVEGYRNFATKLWNAARFAQGYGIGGSARREPPVASLAVNRWILWHTQATIQALDLALADLRFDEAANTIYHFAWDLFCDWYLELIKPAPVGDTRGEMPAETQEVAGWVLDQILAMLHPFMPFLTEELWHALAPREHDLIVGHWPMADARAIDPAAVAEVDWLIRLVTEIRTARAELNVPPAARLPLLASGVDEAGAAWLAAQLPVLQRLARVERIELAPPPAGGAAQVAVDGAVFALPLAGVVDLAAERGRLDKALAAAAKERDALAGRLANPAFAAKAKPEAVAKAEADHAAKAAEAERLAAALARLG